MENSVAVALLLMVVVCVGASCSVVVATGSSHYLAGSENDSAICFSGTWQQLYRTLGRVGYEH